MVLAGLGGLALLGPPTPLFNPLTSTTPLSPRELLAGPFGLLAFLPLLPVVRLLARRWRRAALIVGGLIWLLPTLGLPTATVLLCGVAAGSAWVVLLGALRRRERLSRHSMIALVWLGLHALVLPLWWYAHPAWYPSRMAVLHNVGLAYFLLRLVAWGVELAGHPQTPLRLGETICWLLYPPCMRLGPVLLRTDFLRRFDAWDTRQSPAWRLGARRLGLMILGGLGLMLVGRQIPVVLPGAADFFAAPENYSTGLLLRAFYLVPVQIYLLLWTYNQLALALSLWIGLPVDDNFRRLPLATSVRDFWHRWHVTVGAWLRNYIYFPLGGNRRHAAVNTLAVFAYCGMWHGASWSFLAWGLSQVVALAVQRGWDRVRAWVGWAGRPAGHPWTVFCWLLTMHYQVATIVIFADFEHAGWRLLRELLWQRCLVRAVGS